jgi:hypothetical protein
MRFSQSSNSLSNSPLLLSNLLPMSSFSNMPLVLIRALSGAFTTFLTSHHSTVLCAQIIPTSCQLMDFAASVVGAWFLQPQRLLVAHSPTRLQIFVHPHLLTFDRRLRESRSRTRRTAISMTGEKTSHIHVRSLGSRFRCGRFSASVEFVINLFTYFLHRALQIEWTFLEAGEREWADIAKYGRQPSGYNSKHGIRDMFSGCFGEGGHRCCRRGVGSVWVWVWDVGGER